MRTSFSFTFAHAYGAWKGVDVSVEAESGRGAVLSHCAGVIVCNDYGDLCECRAKKLLADPGSANDVPTRGATRRPSQTSETEQKKTDAGADTNAANSKASSSPRATATSSPRIPTIPATTIIDDETGLMYSAWLPPQRYSFLLLKEQFVGVPEEDDADYCDCDEVTLCDHENQLCYGCAPDAELFGDVLENLDAVVGPVPDTYKIVSRGFFERGVFGPVPHDLIELEGRVTFVPGLGSSSFDVVTTAEQRLDLKRKQRASQKAFLRALQVPYREKVMRKKDPRTATAGAGGDQPRQRPRSTYTHQHHPEDVLAALRLLDTVRDRMCDLKSVNVFKEFYATSWCSGRYLPKPLQLLIRKRYTRLLRSQAGQSGGADVRAQGEEYGPFRNAYRFGDHVALSSPYGPFRDAYRFGDRGSASTLRSSGNRLVADVVAATTRGQVANKKAARGSLTAEKERENAGRQSLLHKQRDDSSRSETSSRGGTRGDGQSTKAGAFAGAKKGQSATTAEKSGGMRSAKVYASELGHTLADDEELLFADISAGRRRGSNRPNNANAYPTKANLYPGDAELPDIFAVLLTCVVLVSTFSSVFPFLQGAVVRGSHHLNRARGGKRGAPVQIKDLQYALMRLTVRRAAHLPSPKSSREVSRAVGPEPHSYENDNNDNELERTPDKNKHGDEVDETPLRGGSRKQPSEFDEELDGMRDAMAMGREMLAANKGLLIRAPPGLAGPLNPDRNGGRSAPATGSGQRNVSPRFSQTL